MAGSEHLQVPQASWNFRPHDEYFDGLAPDYGTGKAQHAEEEKKLRIAYGEGEPVNEGHYSQSLPRPRKVSCGTRSAQRGLT